MGNFTKNFLFAGIFLTLTGCESNTSSTVYTGETLGKQIAYKSCSTQGGGGGSISVHRKSGYSYGGSSSQRGPVILKGTGLKSSIMGCPSPVSFKCEAVAVTEQAFGNNLTGNERYVCNGGTANFSYNAGSSNYSYTPNTFNSNPYHNPYNNPYNNPYGRSHTSSSSSYQYSGDILRSEVWLLAQGPGEESITGNIQFHITAGRQIPLPCRVQFTCK